MAQWSNWSLSSTLLALAFMFATYLLRAYRIRDYFRECPQVSFCESCRITLIHNLVNNLMPMRSGEASFPLMMRKSFDLPYSTTTGALLFFRLLDLQALLALGSLAWVSQTQSSTFWWFLWIVFAISPLLLLPCRKFVSTQLISLLPENIAELAEKILSGTPRHYDKLLRTLALTWLNWSIKILIFAWILMSFADFTVVQAVTGAMGGELSSILPLHAPAGIGTYEAGVAAGAALTGTDLDNAVAAAVNLHILIILGTLTGGILAPLIRRHS